MCRRRHKVAFIAEPNLTFGSRIPRRKRASTEWMISMKNNVIIRGEEKNEYREVENLVRESFWNVYRPGCLEHFVLHQ